MLRKVIARENSLYLFKHYILLIFLVVLLQCAGSVLDVSSPNGNKIRDLIVENFTAASVFIVFIAPIIEETIFRLSLKRNRFFWISVLWYIILILSDQYIIIDILCMLAIFCIIYKQIFSNSQILNKVLIVISIMTFVMIHFSNYSEKELIELDHLSLCFLFLPQFFSALILTKIRLETFFINCIILHGFYNLTILIISVIFKL